MRFFFAFLLAFFVGAFLFLLRLVLEEFFGAGFAVFRLPFVTLTRSQSEADYCQNKKRMFHRARWIRDLSEKGNPIFPDEDKLIKSRAFDSLGGGGPPPKLEISTSFLEFPFEGASRRRSLVNHDLTEAREVFFKLPPKPSCHDLNRGALEAFNIIEVGMIHFLQKRSHGLRNAFVVVNPADGFVDLTFDMNFHLEAVTVHLTAFVVIRQTRQSVSCLKAEIFDNSCAHGNSLGVRIGLSPPPSIAKFSHVHGQPY
jgi:hypothetical protein